MDGELEEGLLEVGGETGVEGFQLGPGLLVAGEKRKEFFDFRDDALLFGERGERNGIAF